MNALVFAAAIGFANLAQLVAAHPLHGVLTAYDREIAALRSTQTVPGLSSPAADAQRNAAALRRDAAVAAGRVGRAAGDSAAADRAQENAALSMILALGRTGDRDASSYAGDVRRETAASLSAYEGATAQRISRALDARRQQLLEKESSLAYDLARRDGAEEMILRLKLNDLHLSHNARAALQAQLSARKRRDASTLDAARRRDAVMLAKYGEALRRDGATVIAEMAAQLHAKAAANLAVRRRVFQAESKLGAAAPNAASQAAFFRSSYGATSATAISTGFHNAGNALATRFAQLGQADGQSRAATTAQIRTLEGDREALYRSIVAQITRAANALARRRHLRRMALTASPPRGSTDLTAALRAVILTL